MSKFWDLHQSKVNIDKFRADTQYLGIQNIFPYEEVVNYIKTLETPWLDILHEDDAFEIVYRKIDGKIVSRDLLDSIIELEFLEKQCSLPLNSMNILDIGAGYGRFAHRLTKAYPDSYVYCTDKIQVSLDICNKYLKYRNVKNAEVVHPNNLDGIKPIDLAVNIHSFPECSKSEINEWLDWIVNNGITKLFIVPHQWNKNGVYGQKNWNCEMFCIEDGTSFRPDIENYGFKLSNYWKPLECNPREFYFFEL